MKGIKLLISLVIIFTIVAWVYASANKEEVILDSCIDGDTARFILNDQSIKVRFLAIDAPKLDSDNPFGLIASEFTCRELHHANRIELIADSQASNQDRYGHFLRFVYVDGELLQLKLVERGYAEVAYSFGDYKYNEILLEAKQKAQSQHLGMWRSTDNNLIFVIIAILVIGVVLFLIRTDVSKEKKKEF